MKIAILTLAHNEQETIGAVLKNWQGFKHLVLLSNTSWHNDNKQTDYTESICNKHGATVIKEDWKSETEQRNFGLDYLADYDFVLIIDADELYTEQDKQRILSSLQNDKCYVADKMEVYWKTLDYTLSPMDTHQPVIAVKPREIRFKDKRDVNTGYRPVIGVTMHHLSFCKSDTKILEKIKTFEHYNEIDSLWYNKFVNWKFEDFDIHPYKKGHRAIHKPLPEELKQLVCSSVIPQQN